MASSRSRREPSLAQLVRRSPALDGAARRQWLAVLPHLTPDDRERLREILLVDLNHAYHGAPDPHGPQPPLRRGEGERRMT